MPTPPSSSARVGPATSPDLGIAEVLKAVPAEVRRLHDEPIGQLWAQGSVRRSVDGVVERLR